MRKIRPAAAHPEVTVIDRQKYISELGKLLEGMSDTDREQILAMISACFDAGSSDSEVIERLGSPTKAAISVLRNYKPAENQAPAASDGAEAAEAPKTDEVIEKAEAEAEAEPEPAENVEAGEAGEPGEAAVAPVEPAPVDEESFPDIESMLDGGNAPVGGAAEASAAAAEPAAPVAENVQAAPDWDEDDESESVEGSRPRFLLLIPYSIAAIVIGVPVTILLILFSLAALAVGLLLGFSAVVVVSFCFLGLTAVADVLLVAGAGLMLTALCLPLLLLAVTIFIKGVIGFIELILALGGRWCWTHGEE